MNKNIQTDKIKNFILPTNVHILNLSSRLSALFSTKSLTLLFSFMYFTNAPFLPIIGPTKSIGTKKS